MTHNSRSHGHVDLNEVLSSIPSEIRREKPRTLGIATKAAKGYVIGVEDNLICAALFHTNAVVRKAFGRVEVEDPQ